MLVNIPYMKHMGMDKSTISMAIFNSYFDITRGNKKCMWNSQYTGEKTPSAIFYCYLHGPSQLMNHWPVIQPVIHRHAKSLRQWNLSTPMNHQPVFSFFLAELLKSADIHGVQLQIQSNKTNLGATCRWCGMIALAKRFTTAKCCKNRGKVKSDAHQAAPGHWQIPLKGHASCEPWRLITTRLSMVKRW